MTISVKFRRIALLTLTLLTLTITASLTGCVTTHGDVVVSGGVKDGNLK